MWALAVMYVLLIPCVILFIHTKHKRGGSAPLSVALKAASTTVIALTAIAGLAGARESMRSYAILTAAAVLFAVSDGLLAYNTYKGAGTTNELSFLRHCCSTFHQMADSRRPLDWISLCCYFAGQSLFAASVFCL